MRGDAIILCVGGHPRRLPVAGAELAVTSNDILDITRLPDAVAIVGSGATGAQLATVFNAFGCDVTLLEVAPRILPGADHDVARVLEHSLRAQGVAVHTGITTVESIEDAGGGRRRLTWRDHGGQEHCRTSTSPATRTARRCSSRAANAVLGATRTVPHALLPSGGFTDPDIGGIGLSEHDARARDRDCLVAYVPYASNERAIIDRRTTGFFKLIADRRRSLLLGAHAAGEQAVEVIQAVTTAMAAGVDVATVARVEFAYPTYTAIVGEAAKRLLAEPAPAGDRTEPKGY